MDKNVDIQYSRWGFSTIRIISIRRSEATRCLLSWLYYGGRSGSFSHDGARQLVSINGSKEKLISGDRNLKTTKYCNKQQRINKLDNEIVRDITNHKRKMKTGLQLLHVFLFALQ
jgi:hypothetical protein